MSTIPAIRKAVIPAGGLGTRFLPVTKAVPKELLPILDKPALQYVVEEAAEAGIQEVIIVISPGKEAVAAYFQPDQNLEEHLARTGSQALLERVRQAGRLARVSFVVQHRPLGLGHAVLTAKDAVGREPFVVMLPDDIVMQRKGAPGVVAQMLEVYHRFGGAPVVAVEEVPWEAVHNYGVVAAAPLGERVHRVSGLVEKPPREQAPSNLSIVGRYLLPPEIFHCLEHTRPGAKGEIQLTDGMAHMLEERELYAYQFQGRRHDTGNPLGLLKASLEFALANEATRPGAQAILDGLNAPRAVQ